MMNHALVTESLTDFPLLCITDTESVCQRTKDCGSAIKPIDKSYTLGYDHGTLIF